MITGAVISIFTWFVTSMIGLLPVSTGLPDDFGASLTLVLDYAKSYGFIFPMQTLIEVAILAVTFHTGILGFKLVNWIIGKLRGSN